MMQTQMGQMATSPSSSDDPTRGMSDEEELRRIGQAMMDAQGLGEVLLDYGDELEDLGLRSEK